MEGTEARSIVMDSAILTLYLLGEIHIQCGPHSLEKSLARKEQALLVYLLCQPGQRFSRDHLATLLWSETAQSYARYNLRRALWNLRRVLERSDSSLDTYLEVTGDWIAARDDAPCWVDVREFEAVLDTEFRDLESQIVLSPRNYQRVRYVLDLYRGEFLAGFSVPNAPEFEEWLLLARERLFLLLLRALTNLIQKFIALRKQEEAIAACQRLLTLDPLQEDVHRLLMRLYWENGQRSQALRQYRVCRDILQRELGISPMEETQKLFQHILDQEAPPTMMVSSLVRTSRITPPELPPEVLPRPRLFALLDRGLAPHVRLILISAPPGYGKTTLVAQWMAMRKIADAQRFLIAWYRVNEMDNAPAVLATGLAAAIDRLWPGSDKGLQGAFQDLLTIRFGEFFDGDPIIKPLIASLESLSPATVLLVLDDLECLTDAEGYRFLGTFLENLPLRVHLCLLTRTDPPLPLPRLRVRGQLLELRTPDLRFTVEESREFLQQSPGLNLAPVEMEELVSRSEGWVAPLWLASNTLSRFTTRLDDVWEGIFAYLREEVLDTLHHTQQQFLLRSVVLEPLTPAICTAILGENHLPEIERRNLFIERITSPSGGLQYRYHPLFRDFLRLELHRRLSSSEIQELYRQVASWKESQHTIES